MSVRYFYSRKLRAAQLEYSQAESDLYGRFPALTVGEVFEMVNFDLPFGDVTARLFIRKGREAAAIKIAGAAAVERWERARAECDRLLADPRHFRKECICETPAH